MRRIIFTALLALLFALPASAQYATRIFPRAADPAACTPGNGEVYYNTATNSVRQCIAANTWGPVGFSGVQLTLAQGTLLVSTPVITTTATWNAGAVTFQNILSNITNTASAADSTLIDLQVGGASLFNVTVGGRLDLGPQTVAGIGITNNVVGGQTQGVIIGNGDGTTVSFAELAAATNGAIIYCDDCTKATPCAGAGTGALAKRLNGAWDCD